MGICNKCGKEGEIVKPGLRCLSCVNEYKKSWQRKRKNRKCAYCGNEYVPNSSARECSMKCRLMNKMEVINGCWEWQGKILPTGYGEIRMNSQSILVHRCSYETFVGVIPAGKNVCHVCDNRKCINPEHLWIGSHQENMQDAVRKKRMKGTPGYKHTEETKAKFKFRKKRSYN